ncbi:hypothetical protein CFP56_035815, partial [Quercus suber]
MVFQLKCFGMFTMGNAVFMFQTCLSAEKLAALFLILRPHITGILYFTVKQRAVELAYKYSPLSAMDSASIDNN